MSNNKILSNVFGKTTIGSSLPVDIRGDLTKNYSIVSSTSHLILSSSAGSLIVISGSLNVIAGAMSGTLSGSFSGSVDVSGGRLIGVMVSGAFSGSVDVSSGKLNNSLGHLILSSSGGSTVYISGNLSVSSSLSLTGSSNIFSGAINIDDNNRQYHIKSNSHLILSSSIGSRIVTSGSLLTLGDQYVYKAANPTVTISEAGSTTSFTEISDTAATQMTLRKTVASGEVLMDVNPVPSDGSGNATVRFFRETNTSGASKLTFHKGDGTATIHAVIGVGSTDTYFSGTGNVGIGTSTPNAFAKLDIVASAGALLIPRLTNAQKDALTPAAAMMIYNTDSGSFQFYNTTWKIVTIV